MTNQNDFVIDNGTGLAVRQDIQDALQALAGLSSGSSNPSTTYAFQLFANTSTNKIRLRNAANDDFIDLFTTSGGLAIVADSTFTADVTFDGATAGRDIVFDRSDNALEFADNAKATFGSSADFSVFHDGSNSFIDDTGTGDCFIRGDSSLFIRGASNQDKAKFTTGGSVELYFDDSKKFQTSAEGVDIVSGNLTITDNFKARFGAALDLLIYHDGSVNIIDSVSANLEIRHGSEKLAAFAQDGQAELYFDGALRFKTASAGLEFHNLTAGSGNSDLRYNSSTGAVFFDTSTILVKRNIENVPYGLETLNKLQPRIYERIDDYNKVELGFIAEEVDKLIPEIVPKIEGKPVNVEALEAA